MLFSWGTPPACGYRAGQLYADASCCSALVEEDGWGLKSIRPSLPELCMQPAPRQPLPEEGVLYCDPPSLIRHLFLIGTESLETLVAALLGTDKMLSSKNHLVFVRAELAFQLRLDRQSASRWRKDSGSVLENSTLC